MTIRRTPEQLARIKAAKGSTWYDDNWAPYCCRCSSCDRMLATEYGFRCGVCGNQLDFDLMRRPEGLQHEYMHIPAHELPGYDGILDALIRVRQRKAAR